MKNLKMLSVITLCLFFVSSCNDNPQSNYSSKSSSSNKKSTKEKEESNPSNYLSVSGKFRSNLLGSKLVVYGKIKNKAKKTTYKDALIELTYYSKTNTNLGSEKFTIWEKFPPSSTTEFEVKVKNYSNVSTISLDVADAENY